MKKSYVPADFRLVNLPAADVLTASVLTVVTVDDLNNKGLEVSW